MGQAFQLDRHSLADRLLLATLIVLPFALRAWA